MITISFTKEDPYLGAFEIRIKDDPNGEYHSCYFSLEMALDEAIPLAKKIGKEIKIEKSAINAE